MKLQQSTVHGLSVAAESSGKSPTTLDRARYRHSNHGTLFNEAIDDVEQRLGLEINVKNSLVKAGIRMNPLRKNRALRAP